MPASYGKRPGNGCKILSGWAVDPIAYAPLAKEIAAEGYSVIISKMPFNLAILDHNVADEIIQANPRIMSWTIGGHSLGGVMAA